MAISVFDLFKIGIGPSSSHTVGPMRAARMFALRLAHDGLLEQTARVRSQLTARSAPPARATAATRPCCSAWPGTSPTRWTWSAIPALLEAMRGEGQLVLHGGRAIAFDEKADLIFHRRETLPFHANGMRFVAFDAGRPNSPTAPTTRSAAASSSATRSRPTAASKRRSRPTRRCCRTRSTAATSLLRAQRAKALDRGLMRRNERHWRSDAEIDAGLLQIWRVMQDCVKRGCGTDGVLPGGFKVKRRAAQLYRDLTANPEAALRDPLQVMDWVNLYALAVNEENAAGGRVVTAPTNGAAGIVPAVLHYYTRFAARRATDKGVIDFLLTAAAIGILYKENASISGAEVGCQGEVGVACSMAAGALCAVMGGTPEQVENAAEIGMEHHLGLTCDPVGGLVQIPCIERNAIASVKAINAARMALRGDGTHHVSLDKVIKTMRETGADMMTKYKETARGGLAVNIVEC